LHVACFSFVKILILQRQTRRGRPSEKVIIQSFDILNL
jgi:hypothetical protein